MMRFLVSLINDGYTEVPIPQLISNGKYTISRQHAEQPQT